MARARRAWRGPEGLQRSRIGVYRQAPGHSPGETGHELGPLPVPAQPQPQLAPVADHRIDEVLAAEPAGLEGRLPPPPEPQADADVVTEPVLPLPALEECLAEACPEFQGLLGKLQPWSAVAFEDFHRPTLSIVIVECRGHSSGPLSAGGRGGHSRRPCTGVTGRAPPVPGRCPRSPPRAGRSR